MQWLFCYLLQKNFAARYRCGADFLPSPLASKPEFALTAEAMYTRKGLLTAVAIAVEHEHTIAFLGNSVGEVFKVNAISTIIYFRLNFSVFMSVKSSQWM